VSQRKRSSSPKPFARLNSRDEVSRREFLRAVKKIRGLDRCARDAAWSAWLETGRLVLEVGYGGDVDRYRANNPRKGASLRDFASALGKSLGSLSERVNLYLSRTEFPPRVRAKITPTHAVALLSVPEVERPCLLLQTTCEGLSTRELDARIACLGLSGDGVAAGVASQSSYRPLLEQTGDNERYTPVEIIDTVRDFFGGTIDLDPASCAEANKAVRARRFFDAQMDGLTRPWKASTVFVNPPFGKTEEAESRKRLFLEHMAAEFENGHFREGIILLPDDLGAARFARIISPYPAVWLEQPPSFRRPGGDVERSAWKYLLVYFGPRVGEFYVHCARLGRPMLDTASLAAIASVLRPIVRERAGSKAA
jgi:hypothetical protein